MKETSKVRRYLTKVFNKDNTVPFAWYNTEYYKLTIDSQIKYSNYSQIKSSRKLA